VAELRGDVGRRHTGGGQERRRGVTEGVHVHRLGQADAADQVPERLAGVVGPDRGAVELGDDQVLVDVVGRAKDEAAFGLGGAVAAQLGDNRGAKHDSPGASVALGRLPVQLAAD
jgi:hypothetical protein